MKLTKLWDNVNKAYMKYVQTGEKKHHQNAMALYKQYKKQGGKRIQYQLQYILNTRGF